MLEPIGFWSYARHDDEHSDGDLSQLRAIVGKQIGLQYGARVMLWQDVAAIPYGADWAATIERTIGQTTFFVPIVTPRFLKSQYCFDEFMAFRRRMEALERDDLIFPIHYVDVSDIRPAETVFGEHLAALQRHQWIDFRPLFYHDPKLPDARRWAGGLATAILKALRSEAHLEAKRRAEAAATAARRVAAEAARLEQIRREDEERKACEAAEELERKEKAQQEAEERQRRGEHARAAERLAPTGVLRTPEATEIVFKKSINSRSVPILEAGCLVIFISFAFFLA